MSGIRFVRGVQPGNMPLMRKIVSQLDADSLISGSETQHRKAQRVKF